MPGSAFFRKLGFFLANDFLDPMRCAEICSEMRAAPHDKGTIVSNSPEQEGSDLVDESIRKVLQSDIARPSKLFVRARLDELRPKLEEHFKITLTGRDGPQFLRYWPGAFYVVHRDASPKSPPEIASRRVSVVIFLNRQSEQPKPCSYGGGSLRFYGLLDGPHWKDCAFSLEPEPGLLVAFPSSTLHEVLPVTFGERFSIVSWFTGPST